MRGTEVQGRPSFPNLASAVREKRSECAGKTVFLSDTATYRATMCAIAPPLYRRKCDDACEACKLVVRTVTAYEPHPKEVPCKRL